MTLTLQVTAREARGKSAARKVRREGMVPGVVYGKGTENVAVLVDGPQLQRLLQSEGSGGLIDLVVDGKKQIVLIKGVQSDPVMGRNLHVDFHAVDLDQEVLVTVPIVIVGEESRENDGGIVAQNLRELSVYCLPTAIPERLEVDISPLVIGGTITVGEIPLPEGIRTAQDLEEAVVSILAPAAAPVEDTEAAGQEGGETEAAEKEDEGEGQSQSE